MIFRFSSAASARVRHAGPGTTYFVVVRSYEESRSVHCACMCSVLYHQLARDKYVASSSTLQVEAARRGSRPRGSCLPVAVQSTIVVHVRTYTYTYVGRSTRLHARSPVGSPAS